MSTVRASEVRATEVGATEVRATEARTRQVRASDAGGAARGRGVSGRMMAAMVAASLVLAAAACGSGPTPEDWAGQVCGALSPWRDQIAELNTKAQERVSAATTPAQTRTGLVDLLAGGESASETARATVVAAGTPDVDGGGDIAGRFAASLSQTRDAYAHARADLEALSTSDAAAFYDGVSSVLTTLNAEYTRGGIDTANLDSVELRDAFDQVDRCQ